MPNTRSEEGVEGLAFLGREGGLGKLLAKGAEKGGPPRLAPWGGARVGCRSFNGCCEGGESGREPLVELGRGGGPGEGGISQSLSLVVGLGKSASCQRGLGFSLWGDGGSKEITMGSWSDPVEGSVDGFHERKAGKICSLVKAMSMALGLWVPVKGNRVLMQWVLRRVKPKSLAGLK